MNKDKNEKGIHIPIMMSEVIKGLNIQPNYRVIDCTANRGGHSIEFAKLINSDGLLICNDLDNSALIELESIFKLEFGVKKNIIFTNDNFANIVEILESNQVASVDRIFADLGVSSQEIDTSGRGFTFMYDEPLLMTYASQSNEDNLTAKDIVNNWNEDLIADIIYNFSDETYARRIAREIVSNRKVREINTTFDLVEIIKRSVPKAYQNKKIHFATKTFQAIRMAVNKEVDNIIKLLESTNKILSLGGRIAIITFHSVEDRIVKQKAKEFGLKMVYKKPITPSREEIINNKRSRSAKLRIYEYNI